MEAITRDEAKSRSSFVGLQIHVQNSGQQPNGLVLYAMILITQRFPFVDMKNFPDIALSLGPDELMTPWFVDFRAFVANGLHRLGATITDFPLEGKTIAIVSVAKQVSLAAQVRQRQLILMMWKVPRATGEWNRLKAFATIIIVQYSCKSMKH
jgi:hypothetical protein